jgi:hypothetical protein
VCTPCSYESFCSTARTAGVVLTAVVANNVDLEDRRWTRETSVLNIVVEMCREYLSN